MSETTYSLIFLIEILLFIAVLVLAIRFCIKWGKKFLARIKENRENKVYRVKIEK